MHESAFLFCITAMGSNVTEKSGIYENVFIHMTTSLSKNMQKKREKCQKSTYLSENIAILTNL